MTVMKGNTQSNRLEMTYLQYKKLQQKKEQKFSPMVNLLYYIYAFVLLKHCFEQPESINLEGLFKTRIKK